MMIHTLATASVVDCHTGRNYFASLLGAPVKPLFEGSTPGQRKKQTANQRAAADAVMAACRMRNYKLAEKVFAQFNGICSTSQFAKASKRKADSMLKQLEEEGAVKMIRPSKGITPATWKWIGAEK
jgi:hypothetical protein